MPKLHDAWTVLPHGPLHEIDEGILTVAGDIPMPLGNFPRRMTVIGLARKRTAIFSAIALPEPQMQRIEALGQPVFLIVPNPAHRLDAKSWKERYPKIEVVAPPGARKDVEEAVPVDDMQGEFGDAKVDFVAVAGTKERESALIVRRPSGTTLIVNDIIGHVRHPRGLGAKLMARLFGFGVHGPRIPRPVASKLVEDKPALARQLRGWAELPDLKRIIVSHGEPIADNPAGVLARIAEGLEA
ncbi:MAG TPA: hypothetical protein VLK25_14290 [Allosphingosinicella sp.]|nr:hypothetical protein [Allosphingosinicella sp.]